MSTDGGADRSLERLAQAVSDLGGGVKPATNPLVLTDNQLNAIARAVREHGSERIRNFGVSSGPGMNRFNEADFLTGAMAVIYALTGSMSQVPPLWILGGPMVGRSIVDPDGHAVRRYKETHAPVRRRTR